MSEYLDQKPQPCPPLPFVVEEEGPLLLFIRRRDGQRYEIGPRMYEQPDAYRERVELHCKWFNDTYDYGAREERRRAQATGLDAATADVRNAADEIAMILAPKPMAAE